MSAVLVTVPPQLETWTAPLFAAAVFSVAIALGDRLLRLFRVPVTSVTKIERSLFAASIGLGALQFLIFALGMAHAFRPRALFACFAALAAVVSWDVRYVLRGALRALRGFRLSGLSPLAWVTLSFVALGLLLRLPTAMSPPTDFDGVWYHLGAPRRWLDTGYLGYLPTLNMTLWPMGTEMLYALGLVWADCVPRLLHFGLGLLLLLAVFSYGRRLASPWLGLLGAAIVLIRIPNLADAYIDCSVSFHFICALLAFALWQRTRRNDWLFVSALSAGIAASCKLTAAPLGVALTLAVAYEELSSGPRRAFGTPWVAIRKAGWVALLALAPLVPFLVRAGVLTGNPFYPFMSQWIPTRDWSAAAGATLDTFVKYGNWGQGHAIPLTNRRLIHHLACATALALTLVGLRLWRARPLRTLVGITGFLLVVFLWSTGPYPRYLLPVASAAIVLVLVPLEPPLKKMHWLAPLTVVVALYGFLQAARAFRRDDFRVVLGLMGTEAYLDGRIPIYPLWQYANTILPQDAPLLVLYPGNFYLRRATYVVDPIHDQFIHYDAWSRFRTDLIDRGICYLIAPIPVPPFDDPIGYAPLRQSHIFLNRLVSEAGKELAKAGDSALYALSLENCKK